MATTLPPSFHNFGVMKRDDSTAGSSAKCTPLEEGEAAKLRKDSEAEKTKAYDACLKKQAQNHQASSKRDTDTSAPKEEDKTKCATEAKEAQMRFAQSKYGVKKNENAGPRKQKEKDCTREASRRQNECLGPEAQAGPKDDKDLKAKCEKVFSDFKAKCMDKERNRPICPFPENFLGSDDTTESKGVKS